MLARIGYSKFNEWVGYFSQIDQEVKTAQSKGSGSTTAKTMTLGGV